MAAWARGTRPLIKLLSLLYRHRLFSEQPKCLWSCFEGKKALLAVRVSCYLAAGEVIFRLWSLRNHRCVLSDVTSGSFHQLAASSSSSLFFFSRVFIGFIRLGLGSAAAWALQIYLVWTSSLQACVMALPVLHKGHSRYCGLNVTIIAG